MTEELISKTVIAEFTKDRIFNQVNKSVLKSETVEVAKETINALLHQEIKSQAELIVTETSDKLTVEIAL